MRPSAFLVLFTLSTTTLAHSQLWGAWINEQDMKNGRNTYIRSPPDNSPVMNVTSPDMYCNVNGNAAAPQTLAVKAGDNVTFEWFMETRKDEIMDTSHKGPILVYMAPRDDNAWTKIFEDSFDGRRWATDRLRGAEGQHTIVVPDVPAGDYILRAEIITLHLADTVNSNDASRGAAFYPSCVQIRVTSEGSLKLPGDATFPGAYTESEPGLHFDIRKAGQAELLAYKAPGPDVWSSAAGGSIGRIGKRFKSKPTTTTPSSPDGDLVKLWGQCGGPDYHGPKTCVPGAACVFSPVLQHHCRPMNVVARKAYRPSVPLWGQCGGKAYTGSSLCARGKCHVVSEWYSQCIP